jgi:hypothetical protein
VRCRMRARRDREHRDIAALTAPCGRGAELHSSDRDHHTTQSVNQYLDERSVVSCRVVSCRVRRQRPVGFRLARRVANAA